MGFLRTVSTEIEAPLDRVFGLISDIRCHPQWAHNRLIVGHVSGPESGPGAEYSSIADHPAPGMRKPARGSIRVVESAPPHRFGYECHDGGGDYRWTFDLTSSARGTTVHHTVRRLGGPAYMRLVQPLTWRAFGAGQVHGGLANLKRLAERAPITLPSQQAMSPAIELPTETTTG